MEQQAFRVYRALSVALALGLASIAACAGKSANKAGRNTNVDAGASDSSSSTGGAAVQPSGGAGDHSAGGTASGGAGGSSGATVGVPMTAGEKCDPHDCGDGGCARLTTLPR